MPSDIKCPTCSAWTLLTSASKTDRAVVKRYECGNGHRFRIETEPTLKNEMRPRQKPPQARFDTPQAQRWAEQRGAA
jgi:hypothetical protein